MGKRNGEPGTAPAGRVDAKPPPQALERRVERLERGGDCPEPTVLVARAVSLLETREVEERLGKLVALGPLSPGDLLPGVGRVGNVVPEAELAGPDRVEDPAGLPLDRLRDQPGRSADSRSAVTRPEPSQRAASR